MLAVLSYVAVIGAMPAAENNRRDVYVAYYYHVVVLT
jgi:hypothetical protein